MADVLIGPWAALVDEEPPDEPGRAARLARVRADRARRDLLAKVAILADKLEHPDRYTDWTRTVATFMVEQFPGYVALDLLPPALRRRMRRAGEDLELDVPGARERAAEVLRQVGEIISRA